MRGRGAFGALLVALGTTPATAADVLVPSIRLLPDNTPDASDTAAEDRKPGDPPWKLSSVVSLDTLSNTRGGLQRGTRFLAKGSLAASYDAGHGWMGLVSGQYTNGTLFSGHVVGDAQTVSNIEAVGAFRVYQVWLAHRLWGGRIKFGLVDLNADFDVQTAGGLFLNSSDGIGPDLSQTGRNGPSIFPTTALALTAKFEPLKGWQIDLGAFDGVAGDPERPKRFAIRLGAKEGALLIGQLTRSFDSGLRLEAGAWTYTARFPALDRFDADGQPALLRTSHGAYGLVEARLAGDEAQGRELNGWVRAGFADDRVNAIATYLGGGLVLTAPFKARAMDSAGVSVMRAEFGRPARNALPGLRGAETTVELTYRAPLIPRVALQPDIQYVVHPGGLPGVRDALVVGFRLNFQIAYAPVRHR